MMWKQQLQTLVDLIEQETTKLEKEREELKANVARLYEEYTLLQAEIEKTNSIVAGEKAYIASENARLSEKMEELSIKERKAHDELAAICKTISERNDFVANLDKEIVLRKNQLSSIEVSERQKANITADIASLSNKLTEKQEDIKFAEDKISNLLADIKRLERKADADNSDLVAALDKKDKELKAKEAVLVEKEKLVAQKQLDLGTVEARYRKLYAEKGANFKI